MNPEQDKKTNPWPDAGLAGTFVNNQDGTRTAINADASAVADQPAAEANAQDPAEKADKSKKSAEPKPEAGD